MPSQTALLMPVDHHQMQQTLLTLQVMVMVTLMLVQRLLMVTVLMCQNPVLLTPMLVLTVAAAMNSGLLLMVVDPKMLKTAALARAPLHLLRLLVLVEQQVLALHLPHQTTQQPRTQPSAAQAANLVDMRLKGPPAVA